MDDYIPNWNEERESIIDDTLNTLRDQREDQQDIDLNGIINVNPQLFLQGKHLIDGPYSFPSPFQSTPNIVFGSVAQTIVQEIVTAGPTASAYVPFVVHPYVYSFTFNGANVDGFYIGLYALTDVPAGVLSHKIHWRATGSASGYNSQQADQAWNESYDYNEAPHLIDETGLDE